MIKLSTYLLKTDNNNIGDAGLKYLAMGNWKNL
jgi:hypothetical protein